MSEVIRLFKHLKDVYEEQARASGGLDLKKVKPNHRLETRICDGEGRKVTPKKMAREFGR